MSNCTFTGRGGFYRHGSKMNPARYAIEQDLNATRREIDGELQDWISEKKHQGVEFSGSSAQVFWGPVLDSFTEKLAVRAFKSAREVAEADRLSPVEAAKDAEDAASNAIYNLVSRMTEIDRRKRARGLPNTIAPKNPEIELARCLQSLARRADAEIKLAGARSGEWVTLPLSADFGITWLYRNTAWPLKLKLLSWLFVPGFILGCFAGSNGIERWMEWWSKKPTWSADGESHLK